MNARARNTHVEATSNHPCPAQVELATKPSTLKFAVSLYYLGAAVVVLGSLYGGPGPASYNSRRRRNPCLDVVPVVVRCLSRTHDVFIGYAFFAIFLPLSAIRICDVVQTWLLFHNALSEGVVVDDILKQARQSQEVGAKDHDAEIRDLRRQVETQQVAIAKLLALNGDTSLLDAENGDVNPVRLLPQTNSAGDVANAPNGAQAAGGAVAQAGSETDVSDAANRTSGDTKPARRQTLAVNANERLPYPIHTSASSDRFTFQSPDAMPPRELQPPRK